MLLNSLIQAASPSCLQQLRSAINPIQLRRDDLAITRCAPSALLSLVLRMAKDLGMEKILSSLPRWISISPLGGGEIASPMLAQNQSSGGGQLLRRHSYFGDPKTLATPEIVVKPSKISCPV